MLCGPHWCFNCSLSHLFIAHHDSLECILSGFEKHLPLDCRTNPATKSSQPKKQPEEFRLWPWWHQDPERDLWEAAQRHRAALGVWALTAFLFPGNLLYAVGDACQSLIALYLVPGAPYLSISAQPTAASLFQGTGWGRDMAAPHFPPHSFFGPISPAAERFLLSIGFFCVCSHGGGHDLHISQPAWKMFIKTRIIEGSSHGTKREGWKQEEVFVCQRQQKEKVLAKNVLSVVCHLSCRFPHHRAAVQLSLAQKFSEEAGASCRTTWCFIVDAGKSAVTLESPHLELLVGLELEGWGTDSWVRCRASLIPAGTLMRGCQRLCPVMWAPSLGFHSQATVGAECWAMCHLH